jgi:hypothetical protein
MGFVLMELLELDGDCNRNADARLVWYSSIVVTSAYRRNTSPKPGFHFPLLSQSVSQRSGVLSAVAIYNKEEDLTLGERGTPPRPLPPLLPPLPRARPLPLPSNESDRSSIKDKCSVIITNKFPTVFDLS